MLIDNCGFDSLCQKAKKNENMKIVEKVQLLVNVDVKVMYLDWVKSKTDVHFKSSDKYL